MKIAILACTAVLMSTACAYAAAGPALDHPTCKKVWSMTDRQGDVLSKDKAVPYVVDFTMVDTDKDGSIDQKEFMKGCKAGLVHDKAK